MWLPSAKSEQPSDHDDNSCESVRHEKRLCCRRIKPQMVDELLVRHIKSCTLPVPAGQRFNVHSWISPAAPRRRNPSHRYWACGSLKNSSSAARITERNFSPCTSVRWCFLMVILLWSSSESVSQSNLQRSIDFLESSIRRKRSKITMDSSQIIDRSSWNV